MTRDNNNQVSVAVGCFCLPAACVMGRLLILLPTPGFVLLASQEMPQLEEA